MTNLNNKRNVRVNSEVAYIRNPYNDINSGYDYSNAVPCRTKTFIKKTNSENLNNTPNDLQ